MDRHTHNVEIDGLTEATVTSWKQTDGWYARVSGTRNGESFKGENFGPERNRSEAESAATMYHDRDLFLTDTMGWSGA